MNKAILFDCRRYYPRGYMMTRGVGQLVCSWHPSYTVNLMGIYKWCQLKVVKIVGVEPQLSHWLRSAGYYSAEMCPILPRFPRPESIKCCHSYRRLCWPCCTCVALCSSQTISLHEKQPGPVFVRKASFCCFTNLNDSVVRRVAWIQSGAYHDVIGL